jgi:hypothetical protein
VKKITGVTLIVATICIGWYIVYKKNSNPISFSSCKFGMSCEFCKNGSYTEWDPRISDGSITYYNSQGNVLAIVGGMKSNGNDIVKKFKEECQEVK